MGVARGIGMALQQRRQWDQQDKAMAMQERRFALGEQRATRQEARQSEFDSMRRTQFDQQQEAIGQQKRRQELDSNAQYDRKMRRFVDEVNAGTDKGAIIATYNAGKWDDFHVDRDNGITFIKGGKPIGRIPREQRDALSRVNSARSQAEEDAYDKGLGRRKIQADILKVEAAPAAALAKEEQQRQQRREDRATTLQSEYNTAERAWTKIVVDPMSLNPEAAIASKEAITNQMDRIQKRIDELGASPPAPSQAQPQQATADVVTIAKQTGIQESALRKAMEANPDYTPEEIAQAMLDAMKK